MNQITEMPSELNTCKTFFLISGIINILLSLIGIISIIVFGITTCGVGCLLGILPIITIVCSIMDFIAFNKLTNLNQSGTYNTLQFTAICEIVTFISGNLVSTVLGIITLTNINKDNVKSFLNEKGIY